MDRGPLNYDTWGIIKCRICVENVPGVELLGLRPRPNSDFGMHSRDAYPQFADMWVPPGYHIELLRISEYVFSITPGYLASLG